MKDLRDRGGGSASHQASTADALDGDLQRRYVVHEFRSHLNVVIGVARLLSRRWASQDTQGRHLCAALDASAALLLRMVDDWQRAVAPAAAGFSLDCRWLELQPWLQQWLASYAPTAEPAVTQGAAVPVLEFHAASGARVWVDDQRLSQCLFNLLSNAFKYGGHPAAVRLEVWQAGGEVLIVVADAGRGLSATQQQQLFRPDVRLEPGSAAPGEGLGLSLTRYLVEGMGGRIGVESVEGAGTRFTIGLRAA